MTRQEKISLVEELLKLEEKNDIGNLTRAERAEFQQWVRNREEEAYEEGFGEGQESINNYHVEDFEWR